MFNKKNVVLGAIVAASAFAAAPAQAGMSDMDWNMEVGDFYLANEGGLSTDRDVKAGKFSQITAGSIDPNDIYNRRSANVWGGRSALGYKQNVSDEGAVAVEFGYGSYGNRELTRGFNSAATASNSAYPSIQMDYSGFDMMLVGIYKMDGGHNFSVRAGAQRLKADLTQRGLDTETAKLTDAAFGTRFKAGVGYEYMLKDNAGLTANYARFFGDTVDDYRAYPGLGAVRNRPNGVPSIDTVFVGVSLYF